MGEITHKSKRHLPSLVLATIFFVLLAFNLNASAANTATSGRYDISRNASAVEVDPTAVLEGDKSTCANNAGICHLTSATNPQATPNTYVMPTSGYYTGANVYHPGSNRAPAALYPDLVHRIHGGSNWPQWSFQYDKGTEIGYGGTGYITRPEIGVLISGNADSTVGKGSPLKPRRTKYVQEYGTDYASEVDTATEDPGDWNWGSDPDDNTADKEQFVGGCGYPGLSTAGGGCHNVWREDTSDTETDGVPNYGSRTDNIPCTKCHNASLFVSTTSWSTNALHNASSASCNNCHNTGDPPELSSTTVPVVKNCWECHSSTSNFTNFEPYVNTTFAHAGKDCRFCHGYVKNITRGAYWDGKNASGTAPTACGSGDTICHGDSSTTRYVQSLIHGSTGTGYNVTCSDCHVNPTEPAHNLTIPSCNKCHNSTGWSGNADDNSSTTAPVPNWDRANNIYHGNESRGNWGGLNCTYCHLPNVSSSDLTRVHAINSSQGVLIEPGQSGKNYLPSCTESRCHGSAATPGTYITEIHAAGLSTSKPLKCTDCHNNRTISYYDNNDGWQIFEINTSIHSSSPNQTVPFGIERVDESVTKYDCITCHNTSQFNESTDSTQPMDCKNCHSPDKVILNIHDADMEKPTATIDGIHSTGGPNCLYCHNMSSTASSLRLNITLFNSSSSVHRKMNINATENDWGLGTADSPTDNVTKACWGCHTLNGSQPVNGSMGNIYTDPWKCEDCHTLNGSRNASNWTAVNPGSPVPPTVREHFPNQTWWDQASILSRFDGNIIKPEEIITNQSGNGTCELCHSNDMALPIQGAYDNTTWRKNVSHYAQNDSLMASNVNSTRCLFCHNSTATGDYLNWGAPEQYSKADWQSIMGVNIETATNESCHDCHVDDPGVTPTMSFHSSEINPGEAGSPNCVGCHDASDPTNTITVNVTSMNTSTAMHRYLNNRTDDPGSQIGDGWVLAMTNCDSCINWNSQRCWACHSNGSQPVNGSMGNTYTDPWKCEDCHVVNYTSSGVLDWNGSQNYKYNSSIKNITEHIMEDYAPEIDTNVSGNGTCPICHLNDIGETSGSIPKTGGLDASLIANVSHYGTNTSLVANTGQNCTYCHIQGDSVIVAAWGSPMQIRHETDISYCDNCHGNLSTEITFHDKALVKEISVHYAFDWEGDDANPYLPEANRVEACFACHNESGGAGMGQFVVKTCEDCHLPTGTGPFTGPTPPEPIEDAYELNPDLNPWSISAREAYGIPIVYEHVPSVLDYVPDIDIPNQFNVTESNATGTRKSSSSCYDWNTANGNGTCHGVSYDARFDASSGSEGYFMHNQEQYSPGLRQNNATYHFTVIQDRMPNTTNCLWCHNQSDASIRSYWANPPQVTPANMYGAETLQECYECHANRTQPENFHDQRLVIADCRYCHFNYTLMTGYGYPRKFINETNFNQSVHGNQSVIECYDCHTVYGGGGHPPPESRWKWCEDCHVYQAPYPNETQQRHNITDEPQNYYVINKTGQSQSVLDITDCTVCHDETYYNNATATFNRTSGKDCRWCHTFPELAPASPY